MFASFQTPNPGTEAIVKNVPVEMAQDFINRRDIRVYWVETVEINGKQFSQVTFEPRKTFVKHSAFGATAGA